MTAPTRSIAPMKIETKAQAETLIADIGSVLERLAAVINEETRLIRAAKVVAATQLEEQKADLSRRYVAALTTLRANAAVVGRYVPVGVDQLRRRHDAFQAELQINMAVLSTARSVSESLVRGVAEDVAARNTPKVYGAYGNLAAPSRNAARPIAVSRSL
ncbi:MAG: hypothetical protein ACK50Q_00645 [Labrys sp. (in: a-proteobacteria)]